MHLSRIAYQSRKYRGLYRFNNLIKKHEPFIKVLSADDDDFLKLSFKYSNSPYLNIKVPKEESVQMVLSRIKLMVELQRKKEEIRQAVVNKYTNSGHVTVVSIDEDPVDVRLLQNDKLIEEHLPNSKAWTCASLLKIGEMVYDVKHNMPTVVSMSLPEYIVSDCVLRPHFILECASRSDSIFTWYRSISREDVAKLTDDDNEVMIDDDNDKCWLKVSVGFIYYTCPKDVGHFLKVVCTPKLGELVGSDDTVESQMVVEERPARFPFEDRHAFTKHPCGENSVRCVSYNVLANVYVEKRRFPYCSVKAIDNYYRKQILLKELTGYNGDILCLQEVQERNFHYDLDPVLSQVGYSGFYARKGGRRHEGLAVFFRKSKYKLVEQHHILLNNILKEKDICTDLLTKVAGNFKDMSKLLAQDTVFQVLLLEQENKPGQRLLVANTHLYSNKDMPEVRLIQAAVCTYYIEHIVKTKNIEPVALLFCGDFNSLPDSSTYNFMMNGNFECSPTWKNVSGSNENMDVTLRHSLSLASACGTPEYTNFTDEFQGCLDYVFYSKNLLEVSEVVPMPSHEDVTAHVGLPNEYFPSDHIALVCTLKWKNS